jgi:hypothetical protein
MGKLIVHPKRGERLPRAIGCCRKTTLPSVDWHIRGLRITCALRLLFA